MAENFYYGTGRRKSAVARVFMKRGTGNIVVNGKPVDEFFSRVTGRMIVRQPLVLVEQTAGFDILVNVAGGGESGQAGAVRHGITRALIEYDAALKAFEQQEANLSEQRSRWFGVRNFAGNVLADLGKPNFSNYIQRRFDVDAHRRMVMLMLLAKEQQISDEKMPAWLAQSPENLRNPYTLEPMQWDAATRSLVFEGRESQNQNPGNSKTYRVKF